MKIPPYIAMENEVSIAIADSHTLFRFAIAQLIEAMSGDGFRFKVTVMATNGQDLLDQVKTTVHRPKICIIDIPMSGNCGLTMLQPLREWENDVKILVLTNFCNDYCIMESLRQGADGFLSKNATPHELKTALCSLHENGYYHPKELTPFVKKAMNAATNSTLHLTDKEIRFLKLCCGPKTYKDIAAEMHKSTDAINDLCGGLFKKLSVNTRQELAIFAMQTGMVPAYPLAFKG